MATSMRKSVLSLWGFLLAGCLAISLSACASQSIDDPNRSLASTNPTEEAAPNNDAEAEGAAEETGGETGTAEGTSADATPNDQAAEAPAAQAESTSNAESAGSDADAEGAATTATIMYYENVNYDDGDVKPDAEGRVLLGTYELKDVAVGQTLNAWNYVVDIPGYFFWDGWPQNLTVSENPDDNVIKLFYFKLWNNAYTVNYYLMENADLSADNWKDALKPDDVKFIKMGSETFTDQRFDKLVKGDAYEYKIDGTYVVDTYPTEIRVGVNPDDNVINVLYVPDSPNTPDGVEIPDDGAKPDDTTTPDDGTPPDDATAPDDSMTKPDGGDAPDDGTPDQGAGNDSSDKPADTPNDDSAPTPGGDASTPPSLPSDTTFDKNEIEAAVPNKDEVVNDFVASGDAQDKAEITDEMIENPVSKAEADYVKNVYETGLREGESLAQTGDRTALAAVATVAVAAAVVAAIAFALHRRSQRKND